MRPLVAHCHIGLGTLWQRVGEPERARGHLSTAATMYREMGMGFWLEQARVALSDVEMFRLSSKSSNSTAN